MDKVQTGILVNGRESAIPDSGRLVDLLARLKLDFRYVLVELNGEALFKDQIPAITLHPGDKLEIVKPVAGG